MTRPAPRDPARLLAGLKVWLTDGEHLSAVVRISTGHSNDTYLLEGLDRILRMAPLGEGLLPSYDLPTEHAVIGAVGNAPAGPPVPRVRELCEDPGVIGDVFFVMDRAPGVSFEHPHVPDWLLEMEAEERTSMCAQWLGAVAATHNLPASILPLSALNPAEDAARWLAAARNAEGPPELFRILDDLAADPPPTSGAPTPIHGDPHAANCLWAGGRLCALIDWELAMVADPLTDLGWMVAYFAEEPGLPATAGFDLPGWWSRTRVVEAWEEATGRSAIGVRRYEILAMAKIATIFSAGRRLAAAGRSTDPRFSEWATWLPHYMDLITYRAALPDLL